MRFHRKFSRFIGGGGTVLGADAAPTGRPTLKSDNQMQSAFLIVHEWPVHRIAVGYVGPGGAPNLPGTLYVYDELAKSWFEVSTSVTLIPNRLNYFDILAAQPPPVRSDSSGTAGSLEVALVVGAVGGEPAGEYVFAMAPDLTAMSTSEVSTIGVVDQGAGGVDPWLMRDISKLVNVAHDFVALGYSGANLTSVVYRTGGSGGTIVATLALTYTGSRLDTVTRT